MAQFYFSLFSLIDVMLDAQKHLRHKSSDCSKLIIIVILLDLNDITDSGYY